MFKKAVLIIHGFMGETSKMEYLSNYIELNTNIDSYTFTLPGHDKPSLKDVKYEEWIETSLNTINELKKKYNTIYIIGHSMGGVIGSYLASKHKEVKKLVLVAPAFIYSNIESLGDVKTILQYYIKNKDLYEDVIHKITHTSIKSVLEFQKLVKEHYNIVKEIKCSTLIVQGDSDVVIPIKSSNYVYDNLKSKDKYLQIISDEGHDLLYGNKKEKISNYISMYLQGGLKWKIVKNSKI